MPSDASDASVGRFAATNAQRSFNERLILSLMRRHGSLPKAELARLTGLSPTAVGSIIVQLEAAGLVRRGAPQRGRIGQPSVPYAIEPSGAFSLGLKVGRRSAELVLLDASLAIVALSETAYALPSIAEIESFVSTHARRMVRKIDRSRLVGLGVAMPSEIWSWCDEMGVSEDALLTWKDVDFSTQLGPKLNVPVRVMNDATAACAAQLALTQHDGETVEKRKPLSFIYFFVGWFIGGGVVLDGRVLEGRRGNAGALGSMPVCRRGGAGSPLPEQLIRIASVYCLERELLAHGIDPDCLQREDLDWSDLGDVLDTWLQNAAAGVAQAVAAASAVIDFDAAVIDGSFPPQVRSRFVQHVQTEFDRIDRQGLSPIEIQGGVIGRRARAVGAACLPLLEAFAVDEAALPDRTTADTDRVAESKPLKEKTRAM